MFPGFSIPSIFFFLASLVWWCDHAHNGRGFGRKGREITSHSFAYANTKRSLKMNDSLHLERIDEQQWVHKMKSMHPILTKWRTSNGCLCAQSRLCVEINDKLHLSHFYMGFLFVSHQAPGCRQWTNQRIRYELDAEGQIAFVYDEKESFVCAREKREAWSNFGSIITMICVGKFNQNELKEMT